MFYDTLPAVTRAEEINRFLHPESNNNDDSLTSAQALAARALLLTPYDPPADPRLPPLISAPDASEDARIAVVNANKDRLVGLTRPHITYNFDSRLYYR